MDAYLIHSTAKASELESSSLIKHAKPFILGILGSSESYTKETILNDVLYPILEQEGRMPILVLPSEGTSSTLLSIWADKLNLSCTQYECDWKRLGKRARALRDSRILQESTHLILFCGARSDYYIKVAQREAKKGRVVFTVDAKSGELTEWVL